MFKVSSIRNTKYEIRNTEYGIRNTECGIRNAEYGMRFTRRSFSVGGRGTYDLRLTIDGDAHKLYGE